MGNSPYSTLVLIALMVVAFYFLIIRPNKKRQLAQQATMSSLQPGTRVLLTSGVFGTIVEIGEKQAVLELSPDVHLTVLKQAIARAVKPGDEDEPYDELLDTDDADDAYDPDDAARPVAESYGASAVGTSAGTDAPVSWSADAAYPAETDRPSSTSSTVTPTNTNQEPGSGTSTTPIKD